MRFFKKYLFPLYGEILIILLFLVVSNNHLSDRNDLIQADGRGYYEFLPATFIYKDLKLDYLDTLKSDFYDNNLMVGDFYKRLPNGKRFDKYFIGTAVLQAPFFAVGHAWAKISDHHDDDGFSRPYQISIYIAALFYTFLGLIFMRLLFTSYDVNRFWIFVAQTGVIFCTSMLNYMHWDAAYSHIYSFFAISGFLWFARYYLQNGNKKPLFWTIVFFGLIFLIRPVNILVIVFLPLLSENLKAFIQSLKFVFTRHLKTTVLAVITALIIYQIQCITWYFQTGHWFFYAYGEETFNWSDPHMMDFMFSYRKGFFLWAPWFFILFICGIIFHVIRKMWFRLIWFTVTFMLLIYVLSSWWCWAYGGSMGSRPMIDFYPALMVFAAPLFARDSRFLKWIILLLTPVFAYVAVVQVYQYQRGILTLDEMTETSYWKIFLKRDTMYEYYLWKREIPTGTLMSETSWEKHKNMQADRWYIFDTLQVQNPAGQEARVGQITFLSPRKSNAESLEIRLLDMKDSLIFNHYNCMLHAVDEPKGWQFVDYRFEIPAKLPPQLKAVFVINTKTTPVTIDSMKIRFFTD